MANDKIAMLKLKRLLQLFFAGQSQNYICKELGMSKKTVSCCGKASQQTGLTYQELLHLKESGRLPLHTVQEILERIPKESLLCLSQDLHTGQGVAD